MSKLMAANLDLTESDTAPAKVKSPSKISQENKITNSDTLVNNNKIKLYALKNYGAGEKNKGSNDFFYMNGTKFGDAVDIFEGNIKTTTNELKKNNNGYHERIHCDKIYTLFCDIDGLYNNFSGYQINDNTGNEQLNIFISNLKNFFSEIFNKKINEITVTQNKGYVKIDKINPKNKTYGSFHLYCKEYKMTGTNQKIFWKNFAEKYYSLNIDIVDHEIFIKGRWFRSVNQHKASKLGVEHVILVGNIADTICENLEGREDLDELFEKANRVKKELVTKNAIKIITKKPTIIKKNDEIKKLLECLNIKRSDNYNDWYQCGLIIKFELGDNGFEDFNNFSMKSQKYDKNVVQKLYENLKPHENGLKIGTLHYWAKIDNLKMYNEYFQYFNFDDFFSNTSVSNHFKFLFGDRFIYYDGFVYNFNGVFWKKDNKEMLVLHNFLKEDYYDILRDLLHQYDKRTSSDGDNMEHAKKIAMLRMNIEDLRNSNKRDGYVKDIIGSLKNENIKFDSKSHLFAFNNVVFDLKQNEFVQPDPLDYISLSTGYNYDKNYDMKNVDDLDKIINTILRNKEEKDAYLTILSTGLLGITLERFTMATGSGGNGKGVLNDLMLETVGEYGYVIPPLILTMPFKSGSNPEAANMHNKRFVIGREPPKGCKMCSSTIKEITGGDQINARLNYSNITKTKIVCTLLFECNNKPPFDEVTDAVSRRLLEFIFNGKFVSQTDYDKLDGDDKKKCFVGNDFYKTTEFKSKYKQALFEILRKKAEIYLKDGLKIPQSIKNNTIEYLAVSDDIYDWVSSMFDHTKNIKDDVIKLKVLYTIFSNSEFYKNLSFVDKRENNYKKFCNKVENNFFLRNYCKLDTHNVKCLFGFKLKIEENDD